MRYEPTLTFLALDLMGSTSSSKLYANRATARKVNSNKRMQNGTWSDAVIRKKEKDMLPLSQNQKKDKTRKVKTSKSTLKSKNDPFFSGRSRVTSNKSKLSHSDATSNKRKRSSSYGGGGGASTDDFPIDEDDFLKFEEHAKPTKSSLSASSSALFQSSQKGKPQKYMKGHKLKR